MMVVMATMAMMGIMAMKVIIGTVKTMMMIITNKKKL